MANVPALTPASLRRYLRSFEQKLIPVLKACDITFDSDLRLKEIDELNKFELFKFAKFLGVKQRGNNNESKEKLNIFLHFEGKLDGKGCVTKYRTRVSYALVKKHAQPKEICLVRGTHYDFNSASDVLHPVCHAQEDITTLKKEIGEDDFNIQNDGQIDDFQKNYLYAVKNSRVPTPFFDFFSVVIMVLADHCVKKDMPEQVDGFKKILKFVIEELPDIPLAINCFPDKSTLRKTKIKNLHSAHWYATEPNS